MDSEYLRELPLDEEVFLSATISVTAIEANHCPGAALFLFNFMALNRRILHTGDFRANRVIREDPRLVTGSIYSLYLDTTFCQKAFKFPPQQECIDFIVARTKEFLAARRKTIILVGSYSIGKERIVVAISKKCNVPICVSKSKLATLKLTDLPIECFTSDAGRRYVHDIPILCLVSFPSYCSSPLALLSILSFDNFLYILQSSAACIDGRHSEGPSQRLA